MKKATKIILITLLIILLVTILIYLKLENIRIIPKVCTDDINYLCNHEYKLAWSGPSNCYYGKDASFYLKEGYQRCSYEDYNQYSKS